MPSSETLATEHARCAEQERTCSRRRDGQTGSMRHNATLGIIYQATNAVYTGRARAQVLNLLPDGSVFGERSMSKLRSAERGWRREIDVLVAAGATPPFALVEGGKRGDPRWHARWDWMWQAINQTCRRIDHGGNHRYAWAVNKQLAKQVAKLASGDRYPKQVDAFVWTDGYTTQRTDVLDPMDVKSKNEPPDRWHGSSIASQHERRYV
jgi:hypothetical protein